MYQNKHTVYKTEALLPDIHGSHGNWFT